MELLRLGMRATAIATVVTAVAVNQASLGVGNSHVHLLPARISDVSAVCTDATPASIQFPGRYPIDGYSFVPPKDEKWTSYKISEDWYEAHLISGPHYMSFRHVSDPYGPFKCQYTCNAAGNCKSYFGWYDKVDTPEEHFNCVLFDAIIEPSHFVEADDVVTSGAYDRLCDAASSPGGIDRSHDSQVVTDTGIPEMNDHLDAAAEKRPAKVVLNVKDVKAIAPSNNNQSCTADMVTPDLRNGWGSYFPTRSFQEQHGGYVLKNDPPANASGFETMYTDCSRICGSWSTCSSVFIAYGDADLANGDPDISFIAPNMTEFKWICMFFNTSLTADVYTPARIANTWINPYGYNLNCNNLTRALWKRPTLKKH